LLTQVSSMLVLGSIDINSALNSQAFAWTGAFIAVFFFGSNYVVTKQFPVGDGFSFQWFMSLGILLIGYVCLLICGDPIWVLNGLIGGALWATGNAFVPVAIRWAGLGIAFLLWSISNLLTGWCVGKFGLFNLDPQPVATPWLNNFGPVFGVLAMLVYVFIKPTLPEESNVNKMEDEESNEKNSLSMIDEFSEFETKPSFLNANVKRILGAALALTIGLIYGVTLVPFQKWYDAQEDHSQTNALMFVISHYSGVFLMSSFVFIVYTIIKKNKPVIFPQTIFPAMISGAMWGVAQAAWLVSNGTLGMAIGYPIVVVGPMVVNTLWAVLLYREIQGKKNFILLAIALTFNLISVGCTALSYFDFSS